MLLDLGANILNVDDSGYTAAHWAIASGDDETINFFLKRADGRRTELQTVSGVGLLQVAAAAGHWGAAQWLLSRGDDINSVDASARTALHAAVAANKASMAKALVARGAKLGVQDSEGRSPLWLAIRASRRVVCGCVCMSLTLCCLLSVSVTCGSLRGAAARVRLQSE